MFLRILWTYWESVSQSETPANAVGHWLRFPTDEIMQNKKNPAQGKTFVFCVDLWGIEPQPHPCHGCVLPLNYRPINFYYYITSVPSEGIARLFSSPADARSNHWRAHPFNSFFISALGGNWTPILSLGRICSIRWATRAKQLGAVLLVLSPSDSRISNAKPIP